METLQKEEVDGASPKVKKILRVDYIYSRKKRQHIYRKTEKSKKVNQWGQHVLVVRRVINLKGLEDSVEVIIQSQKLTEFLQAIFVGVQESSLNRADPMIPKSLLLHAYLDVDKALESDDLDLGLREDLQVLQGFLNEEFGTMLANIKSLIQKDEIEWDLLPHIFPPNVEIFTTKNTLREPQAARFATAYVYQDPFTKEIIFMVVGNVIDHNGKNPTWSQIQVKIPFYTGVACISSLPIYPFRFLPGREQMRDRLVVRGRKYAQLLEPQCHEYKETAVQSVLEIKDWVEKLFPATGRIMVDPVAFTAKFPNSKLLPYGSEGPPIDTNSLADEDLLVCSHRILGFSFASKIWGAFAVSNIEDVHWDEQAIDRLILEDKKRRIISTLVRSHKPEVDKRLGMVLDITRRWGCVLLIDEADVFLHQRGELDMQRNALVGVFLCQLEYCQCIVILTTNRQQDIDKAFKSRIHFSYHYPPLSVDDRFQIWKNFIHSAPKDTQKTDISEMAVRKLAERHMNGREIKNVVSCALSIARGNNQPLIVELIMDVIDVSLDQGEE